MKKNISFIGQDVKQKYLNLYLDASNSTEDFSIHQNRLAECGIPVDENSVKSYINEKELEENNHYIIVENNSKKEYIFDRKGFLIIVLGIESLNKYCEYFWILESISYNYMYYQRDYFKYKIH
jgi:hypothetical protein